MVAQKTYTNDEFHTFAERVEGRFEWVDGQVVALHSGEPLDESLVDYVLSAEFDRTQLPDFPMPTEKHDDIVSNLHFYMRFALKSLRFKVYSQATFVRDEDWEKSRLPDIIVVGNEEQQRNKRHEITNPVVLMEVLSKSTQKIDQTEKLEEYQGLPTVEEYVMVWQDQPKAIVYRRLSDRKWEEEIYLGLDETVQLTSLGVAVGMKDIYEGVRFEQS